MTEALARLRKSNVKKTRCFGIIVAFAIICDFVSIKAVKYITGFLPLAIASLNAVLTMQEKDNEKIVKAWVMEKEGFGKKLKRTHYLYLGAFLLCVVLAFIMVVTMNEYVLLRYLLLINSVRMLHRSETAVLEKIEESLEL